MVQAVSVGPQLVTLIGVVTNAVDPGPLCLARSSVLILESFHGSGR